MARENQGLQIALIIFVMLTIILGVTTFIFYRQYEEAAIKAGEAEQKLEDLATLVDYVETHNARAYRDANPLAGAFADRHGLPGVASSDAHSTTELGIATTVLPGPFTNAAELRALLPKAQITPGRASYYVRLWTPLAKLVNRARGNGRIRPTDPGATS